jgi:hypothetical protein
MKSVILYCAGNMRAINACVAGSRFSPFTKSYGMILNRFSWPQRSEEQGVLNKIHQVDSACFNQQG